jgi:hypothetical protein
MTIDGVIKRREKYMGDANRIRRMTEVATEMLTLCAELTRLLGESEERSAGRRLFMVNGAGLPLGEHEGGVAQPRLVGAQAKTDYL